jgi:CHAT domain-containing protein/cytochrome c-type biogenesis protein CcmH/NrfG
MIETEEELIQEYADPDLAAGRAFLISEKDSAAPVPKTPEKKTPIKFFHGRALLIAVLLVAVISFAAWFYYSRNSIDRQTTAALDTTYTNGRPLESRITGLKYAPFAITRGEKEEQKSETLLSAERNLLDAVIKERNSGNLHALGRLYLAKGEFKQAIERLEGAKKLAPDDARILSDLGTAYLEKSRTIPDEQGGQQLKMRAMALEEFEKAVEADPKMPEAVFNGSICRQLLALPFQTRRSWQDYLDLDPSSKWAEEARRRLEQMETVTPPVKSSDELLQDFMGAYRARDDENAYRIVSRNREMITGKLIPQRLAKLITESDGDQKTEYLSALEYIGKLEKERSGDPFFLELAQFYSSASKEKLAALREAQELVFRGYELSLSGDHAGTLNAFQNARAIFNSNGNDWEAGICDYWVGYTINRQNDLEKSTAVFEASLKSYGKYVWLSSQYFAWLVHNMIATRQFSAALEYNQKAHAGAERTSDLYISQKALSQKAEIYRRLGQYDEALNSTYQVMLLAQSPNFSLRQRWRDLDSAANLFVLTNLYKTAAAFENEGLRLANEHLDEKSFEYQSYINLGLVYEKQKKYIEAFDSFDKALAIAQSFSNEGLREKSIAESKLRIAKTYSASGDCIKALENYDRSLEFYDTGKFPVNQYDAHKGRLLCYLKNKSDADFQAELPLILGLFRNYRTNIREEENRNSFFENEQDIYDIAIDNAFGKQNYETAFDYSEESRSRSLLDMQASPIEIVKNGSKPEIKFPAAVMEPLKLSEMRFEIPAGTQIIQYSVLSGKTLIWLITREEYSVVGSEIAETDLRTKVSAYLEMLTKHDPENREKVIAAAKELYGLLIGPVKDKLDPGKEICIIPDKTLFQLPFSTLVSPVSNKYFLTEYTFISAPSLNVFLNSTRRAAEQAGTAKENLLSIGNPSFNKEDFPKMERLESARSEAEKVAGFYSRKTLLTGKDALKRKVTAAMAEANVIHFGGHYIVNQGSPLLSGFVLSENPDTGRREDSLLANYEILGDKLGKTRLIVLAACETGVEGYYGGEGMIGASRTFLATGVPLVVASQWAVDSESTADLMVRFHSYRKTGNLSTARALRRAQLDMLEGAVESYRDPYYWAGFVTFGGYAQF